MFVVSILLTLSCVGSQKAGSLSMKTSSNKVVAHRGAFKKNGFPENSLASLREAIRLGCIGSEFDVRMTADDSLIINHDPHYHGLEIEKTSFAQLRNFQLSNGEPIPTLRQYLQEGSRKNKYTKLVLEIKPSGLGKEHAEKIAEKVLSLVNELKVGKQIVYISFDFDILKKLLSLDSGLHTQYLEGNKSPLELKAAGIKGADYHFSVFKANPGWIEEAKKAGVILNAWTVNDSETMDWLLKEGFDYITTNEPEMLLAKKVAK